MDTFMNTNININTCNVTNCTFNCDMRSGNNDIGSENPDLLNREYFIFDGPFSDMVFTTVDSMETALILTEVEIGNSRQRFNTRLTPSGYVIEGAVSNGVIIPYGTTAGSRVGVEFLSQNPNRFWIPEIVFASLNNVFARLRNQTTGLYIGVSEGSDPPITLVSGRSNAATLNFAVCIA